MSTLSNSSIVVLKVMVFLLVLSLDTVHSLNGKELSRSDKTGGFKNTVYMLSVVKNGSHSCHGILVNDMKTVLSTLDCLVDEQKTDYITGGLETSYEDMRGPPEPQKKTEITVTPHDCPIFNIAKAELGSPFPRGTNKKWDLEFTSTIRSRLDIVKHNEHGLDGVVYSYGEADTDNGGTIKGETHKVNWIAVTIIPCVAEDVGDARKHTKKGELEMVLCAQPKSSTGFMQCSDDAGAPLIIHAKVYGLLLPRAEKGKCVKNTNMVFADITKHDCWLRTKVPMACIAKTIDDIKGNSDYMKKCKASGFWPSSTLVIFLGILLTIGFEVFS